MARHRLWDALRAKFLTLGDWTEIKGLSCNWVLSQPKSSGLVVFDWYYTMLNCNYSLLFKIKIFYLWGLSSSMFEGTVDCTKS